MATLYNVDSPITREQRNNINATFQDILSRFTKVSYQITILSGGQDVELLLEEIRVAIINANTAAQEVRTELADKIDEIDSVLNNKISQVDQKLSDLTILENDVLARLTDLNNFLNALVHKGAYSLYTQYYRYNEVEFDGSTYRAKRDNIGVSPPTTLGESNDDWQLIARRGTDAATQNIRMWRGPTPPIDTTMLFFQDDDMTTGQEILIFGGIAAPTDALSMWLKEEAI